ncbi:SAM-dependent methyltransferase [Hyphococcus luteus]|uniref:SAM-dependent methyltransferase n=1 Tax=Hyphococcus luteus TaxID=2058213 RepID=A0A2S7JZ04_9PROT|nr:methyltransferase domain-containing protein [Marinicaulis flavus]PQA85483.1 SAM-dependent methyltransferase [Marinicaulis flavus]
MSQTEQITETARDYYDSEDADNFYHAIWGGEDIHIGLYDGSNSIKEASHQTVLYMAKRLKNLKPGAKVLDIGAGYGGGARTLAREFGAHVTCLNLSTVENDRNRAMNKEQGLDDKVSVIDGSFDDIPCDDNEFDIVWSQDAILHAADRTKVLEEAARVLKKGGEIIFTDPMQADGLKDPSVLQPVYDRIHLSSLGSIGFYRDELKKLGFKEVSVEDLTHQLRTHYATVRQELADRRGELEGKISSDYIDHMLAGLKHWVDGADNGYLAWGILHFEKA